VRARGQGGVLSVRGLGSQPPKGSLLGEMELLSCEVERHSGSVSASLRHMDWGLIRLMLIEMEMEMGL